MAQSFADIRERIRAALAPYKQQLEQGRPKDGGVVSDLLWRFRSQPSHHIDMLVSEACSELRNKDPNITEADISAVIAKYSARAQRLVKEFKEYQPKGLR
jgi:hypothetical protein